MKARRKDANNAGRKGRGQEGTNAKKTREEGMKAKS